MAFSVSLTASTTASSAASGSAIKLVNLALNLPGVARRRAADDLDDLGETGAVADGQRVLAPDPIESLLGHPEGDNNVHVVAVVFLRRVFQCADDFVARRSSRNSGSSTFRMLGTLVQCTPSDPRSSSSATA